MPTTAILQAGLNFKPNVHSFLVSLCYGWKITSPIPPEMIAEAVSTHSNLLLSGHLKLKIDLEFVLKFRSISQRKSKFESNWFDNLNAEYNASNLTNFTLNSIQRILQTLRWIHSADLTSTTLNLTRRILQTLGWIDKRDPKKEFIQKLAPEWQNFSNLKLTNWNFEPKFNQEKFWKTENKFNLTNWKTI